MRCSGTPVPSVPDRRTARGAPGATLRVVGGWERFRTHDFTATWSGKLTTVFQVATLFAAVVWPAAVLPLGASAFGAGLIAVGERGFHFLAERRADGDDV